jgi:SAM dependent carboxyl methyltransferase
VRNTWAAQAQADWRTFLQYRALEMQPSARLLIVGSGGDANGNSGAEALTDLANGVLQQLMKDGVLYRSEYEQMAIPTYYRSAEEWKSRLRLIRILLRHWRFHLIILKKRGYRIFIWNGLNKTAMPRRSQKAIPPFLRRHSNHACS